MSRPLPISRLEKYLIQKNRGSATGRNLVCMLEKQNSLGNWTLLQNGGGGRKGIGIIFHKAFWTT